MVYNHRCYKMTFCAIHIYKYIVIRVAKKLEIAYLAIEWQAHSKDWTDSTSPVWIAFPRSDRPACWRCSSPRDSCEAGHFRKRRLWAIMSFKPYKTAGPFCIFPALLQECAEILSGTLPNVFIGLRCGCPDPEIMMDAWIGCAWAIAAQESPDQLVWRLS